MGVGCVSRLVVVSNRVAPAKDKAATAGGLAVALRSALKASGGAWFGWSGQVVDKTPDHPTIAEHDGVTYATLDLSHDHYESYYNGFANRSLWPLFHYRIDLTTYTRQFYSGYLNVNNLFARHLISLLRPDDVVWVHDYHLIPLGQALRRLGCRNQIGFFLHIPMPITEVLTTLPNHRELIEDLCSYDLVGFQTRRDLRAFADYLFHEVESEVLGDGMLRAFGRVLRAQAFPIGIDTEGFVKLARSPMALRQFLRMSENMRDRALLVGVDRLDYTKGLNERCRAFGRLMDDHPEYHRKVVMMQIAPPSRSDVPEYQDIRRDLEETTGSINGQFADIDWVPIRYINRAYTQASLAGIYRASRVALVTPLRDGMNLVAKEYIASQNAQDPGVLVLSRFAGAADQMQEALIVNPYDVQGVADAMHRGLTMPLAERQERWGALMTKLRTNDIVAWRNTFMSSLQDVARLR